MAKYSYEFKKQVIEAYLSGEGGYKYLANDMVYLPGQTLRNGFGIMKLMVTKDLCVHENKINTLLKRSFLL